MWKRHELAITIVQNCIMVYCLYWYHENVTKALAMKYSNIEQGKYRREIFILAFSD